MSQPTAPTRRVWDDQFERYKYEVFNYTKGYWEFSYWAPPVEQQPVSNPQQSQSPHSQNRVDSASFTPQGRTDQDPSSLYTNQQYTVTPHPQDATASSYSPQQPGAFTNHYHPSTSSTSNAYSQPVLSSAPADPYQHTFSQRNQRQFPRGRGSDIHGTYHGPPSLHYELVDPSFFVRDKSFFSVGKVIAVIINETAGSTTRLPNPVDYNTSATINKVKYQDNFVYTNVRRFVIVKPRHEFCYACPIFTYNGRATTKPGVRAVEHAIAYSWGLNPKFVERESGITKSSIGVVMSPGETTLHEASRIYFGIHHPIQYNVKVKDIGYVPQAQIPALIGNWKEEDDREDRQSSDVTTNAEVPELADTSIGSGPAD